MKALLLVDIQEGLTKKKGLLNESLFIDTINFVLYKYRAQGQLLIFIQHNNNQLKNGTSDWKIDSRLNIQENDIVIQKQHGNAFEKTELKAILVNKKAEEILVCGLASHGCVRSTCIGAINEGFRVGLLRKGHTNWSSDAEARITLVEAELEHLGVKLIDKQEL
mgnify:CR=1 FL=1